MNKKIENYINFIKERLKDLTDVLYHRVIPARDGKFKEPSTFREEIRNVLKKLGITTLYEHQLTAINSLMKGYHTVIATPTASGKSLIYNICVLDALLKNPSSKALYLFPLKALEQDQFKVLRNLNEVFISLGYKEFKCAIFDGDTSTYKRTKIKSNPPNILITNPEMLHLSILPYHESWSDFLSNLKFVVVDEVHTYRGVLGSNMAWVFRRFLRVCNFYGSYPTFVFCSATIGNPGELTRTLTGLDVIEVAHSSSPVGKRHFIFVNPLLEGPVRSVLLLLKHAIYMNLKTIVYTQSRKMTELIGMWIESTMPRFKDKIGVYRAGFLPEERREVEKKLKDGDLIAVVSTSALELGIDIGSLDVCILVGYPGSIMATWQRAGRVGRRQQESVVILVAQQDSLDQYFMRNPDRFFELPPENAVINPHNPSIMEKHLLCAAADLPISKEEIFLNHPEVKALLKKLAIEFKIMEAEDEKFYPVRKRIHYEVSLRGTGKEFVIIEQDSKKIIGTIDGYRAYHETHKGAVYIHNKDIFLVKDISEKDKVVLVKREDLKYYTRVRTVKDTKILSVEKEINIDDLKVGLGKIEIHEKIVGFDKVWSSGLKRIQFVPFEIPISLTFNTTGMWIQLPLRIKEKIERKKLHFMGGIHAVEHVLIGILPLVVLADRGDLGGISIPFHEQLKSPAIFIYDGYQGGVGLVEEAFKKIQTVVKHGFEAVAFCNCESGCPSCIHSPKCGSGNRPLDKEAAIVILDFLNDVFSSLKYKANNKSKIREERDIFILNKKLPHFGVFDIETQFSAYEVGGWHRASMMKLSYAVVYDSKKDKYLHFLEEDIYELFDVLFGFELVVGFNIIKFDYNVLRGYGDPGFSHLPTLDILVEIYKKLNFRVSLNNLARATLNVSKKGDGLDALRWWKNKNLKKLGEYCEEDVRITKELFLFGHFNGYLKFINKAQRVVKVYVDW